MKNIYRNADNSVRVLVVAKDNGNFDVVLDRTFMTRHHVWTFSIQNKAERFIRTLKALYGVKPIK